MTRTTSRRRARRPSSSPPPPPDRWLEETARRLGRTTARPAGDWRLELAKIENHPERDAIVDAAEASGLSCEAIARAVVVEPAKPSPGVLVSFVILIGLVIAAVVLLVILAKLAVLGFRWVVS
jgi:hypothetical protein